MRIAVAIPRALFFFVPSPLKATPFYALRHKTLEKKYGNFLWPSSIKKKKKSRNCSILISDTQTLITDTEISSDTLTSHQDYKWTQPRTHSGYPTTRFTFNLSLSLIKKYIRKVFGWCFTIISSWLVKYYSLATLKYQFTRFAYVTDNQLICIKKSCPYPAWVCIDFETKPITVIKVITANNNNGYKEKVLKF